MNPLQEQIARVLAVPGPARVGEIIGLSYWMKEQDQGELKQWLGELAPKELRIAFGAGVPGEAYYTALEVHRAQKARMERAAVAREG